MSSKSVNTEPFQQTSSRQWTRLVVGYLLFPPMLLICAGDLGWWQGWLYSLVIVTAGIWGHLWAEQRHPGLMAERQNTETIKKAKAWDKVLAPLMAISIAYPLIIVAGLDHRFEWSHAFGIWINLLGFLLVIFGYTFALWAMAENRFFSSVVRIQTERGHEVCDTGPYRFMRHPGYAGNLLALPGIVLALDSVWTLIPVLIAVIITVIRTQLEDTTLQNELKGYKEYAQRVRYRLIPGVY